MKKSLVALAALAATSAFAQFSIDGVADVGYQNVNYKGNSASGIAGNGSSTSQINFRGTNDLGGGLKASFRVETDWNMVSNMANTGVAASVNAGTGTNASAGTVSDSINGSAGSFGNGEIRAGLMGGFGEIHGGAVNYNTLGTYLTGQPFGTAIGSGFRTFYINDAQATSAVRAENALRYVSPTFNGLNVSAYKSWKQTGAVNVAATSASTAGATASSYSRTGLIGQANAFSSSIGAYDQIGTTEIGLNYANGPLAASFSSLKQDFVGVQAAGSSAAAAGTTVSTVNTLGANYTMGATKVFLLNQTNKTDTNSVNNKATTVSATHTMGAVVLMAQTGNLRNVSGTKSQLTGFGIDYNLSKTTAVYARYESIDDKANAMNAAVTPTSIKGTDTKFGRTAFGLRMAY